jgi:type VI secretion system secreted protein Hcp
MALNAFLTLAGQKTGAINGSVTQKGRENSILVHAFDVQITSPRDAATGLATGKRQHQPITIVKEIDKSSPLLWNALVNNENLTTWELRFFSAGAVGIGAAAGLERLIYTITLTNANISSIQEAMLDNEIPANASLPMREEVAFTYQKIQWTWTDGGITASDDWQSPLT